MPTHSPTLTLAATQAGIILGTAAYLSPEQAAGKPVDKRADIWAFGCVLLEMVTGKQPFADDSIGETLAAVIKSEPDLSAVPTELRTLIRACLEKDRRKRLRDIGDWQRLIVADPPRDPARRPLPWMVATVALAIVAKEGETLHLAPHVLPGGTAVRMRTTRRNCRRTAGGSPSPSIPAAAAISGSTTSHATS